MAVLSSNSWGQLSAAHWTALDPLLLEFVVCQDRLSGMRETELTDSGTVTVKVDGVGSGLVDWQETMNAIAEVNAPQIPRVRDLIFMGSSSKSEQFADNARSQGCQAKVDGRISRDNPLPSERERT
jgi:hypothetical protein